jgi:hypothetical protein
MDQLLPLLSDLVWGGIVLWCLPEVCDTIRAFAPTRSEATAVMPETEVPEDLVAFAMQEREAWAQEEVLRAVRERYEELHDWNKVRSAVGIGRIDG